MRKSRPSPFSSVTAFTVLLARSTRAWAGDAPPLTKNVGPYMVLARTFRGPAAEKHAQALAAELTNDFRLPAFVFPTPGKPKADLQSEVTVLVGNEKTLDDSQKLWTVVKQIKPKCLADLGGGNDHLRKARRTWNPLVAAK